MTEQELKLMRENLVRHEQYIKNSDDPFVTTVGLFDYVADVQALLSHVGHLETIIGDRMEEGAFLMQAGAAEERAKVCVIIKSEPFVSKVLSLGQDKVSLGQVSQLLADWPSTLPELLPPQEARVESERLRVENEALHRERIQLLEVMAGTMGLPGDVYHGNGPGAQLFGIYQAARELARLGQ